MNTYIIAHIIHLFCAITFVGGVFFETLILSALHTGKVSRESRREVERALSHRAVRVMPWVVGILFVSGITMALNRYTQAFAHPFTSSFSMQLCLKVLLACSVLVHFFIAVVKMRRHTLTVRWSKYIHSMVLVHMILIVLLAKGMFYFSW